MSNKIIEHDYIVIGAGSGGLLVAVGLQKLKKDIAVVSKNIGGDCTHYGCVPSKTLLYWAKRYKKTCNSNKKEKIKKDVLKRLTKKVDSFIGEEQNLIEKEKYFKGSAKFIDSKTVKVSVGSKNVLLRYRKKCIIATGSSPRIIKIKGLPQNKVVTNEDFFYLKSLPSSITIIGGGPIGAELATACASFDIKTHLVSNNYLNREPKKIGEKSLTSLKDLGIKYHKAVPTKFKNNKLYLDDQTTIPKTDIYLIAVGRVPNVNLNLKKAQVDYNNRGIAVNNNLVTTNKNIFAIGDCTQNPQFTHLAANHGKFVLKKIAIPFAKKRRRALPRVTFTNPPIASVGEFKEKPNIKMFELKFSKIDKAKTMYDKDSYGVVAIDVKSGNIKGASLFGDYSENLISTFTLIIDKKISVLGLTDFITPYPTYANIFDTLTVDYLAYLSKEWKKYPVSSAIQLIKYIIN